MGKIHFPSKVTKSAENVKPALIDQLETKVTACHVQPVNIQSKEALALNAEIMSIFQQPVLALLVQKVSRRELRARVRQESRGLGPYALIVRPMNIYQQKLQSASNALKVFQPILHARIAFVQRVNIGPEESAVHVKAINFH